MATDEQVKRLIEASENLAAYIAMDACRIVAEWPADANIVPYLETLPVGVVREFDEAIAEITLDAADDKQSDAEQLAKYNAAMAEMRGDNA